MGMGEKLEWKKQDALNQKHSAELGEMAQPSRGPELCSQHTFSQTLAPRGPWCLVTSCTRM